MKFSDDITNEELNNLEIKAFEGEVTVVENLEDVPKAVEYLNKFKIIGFDTETRPSFKKGKVNNIALLQFSTEERAILFRTNKIGLPNEIIKIFENPNILKIGVAVHDDIRGLQKLNKFEPNGFVELQQLVKKYGIMVAGLKKMVGIILKFRISKAKQLSNWEQTKLSQGQIIYGATDAWTALLIYKKLTNTKI